MIVDPVPGLLPLLSPDQKESAETHASLLREVVNFSTHMLNVCASATKGRGEEVLGLIMMFRHSIEMLDATAELVKIGAIEPCKILLRSFLECYLFINYIFEEDTEIRAKCFMVCHYKQRLADCFMADPNTESGKKLLATMKSDRFFSGLSKYSSIKDPQRGIAHFQSVLNNPFYKPISDEYDKMVKSKKKKFNWYNMFNGPANLEQLANRLQLSGVYHQIYREWSGLIHASDIVRGNYFRLNTNTAQLRPLRTLNEINIVTSLGTSFGIQIILQFLRHFSPGDTKSAVDWYQKIIAPRMEILIVGINPIVDKATEA